MYKYLLAVLLVSLSCGHNPPSKPSRSKELSGIAQKSVDYIDMSRKHVDKDGFILHDKCDSLLFSGLYQAATKNYTIPDARSSEGSWNRRVAQDCGPEFKNSRSTISRDMMVGVMWSFWKHKDLDSAIQLMDDLKSNLYMLKGTGTPGELFMTPTYVNTLALIIKALGGPEYGFELLLPTSYKSDAQGFEKHIHSWIIALRGSVQGFISQKELDIIEKYRSNNDLNPLFQSIYHKYSDGDQNNAINLLLDESHYPKTELPTTLNHCDEWIIQREYTSNNYKPCEPNVEHTGLELVIIYELIIKG